MPFAQKTKKLSGDSALTLTDSWVELEKAFDVTDRDKLTLFIKYIHNSAGAANQLQVGVQSQPFGVDEDFNFTNNVDGTNDTVVHSQRFDIDPVDRDGAAIAAAGETVVSIGLAVNEAIVKVYVQEIVNSAGAGTVEIWATAGYTSG